MSEYTKEFLEERLKEAKKTEEKLTNLLIHYIGEKQKLKPENDSLRAKLEDMSAVHDKLCEELRDMEADRDGLRDRVEEEKAKNSDTLRGLEWWRNKSIELSSMVRELQREKLEALREVEACINEMEILKKRLEGMKNEG